MGSRLLFFFVSSWIVTEFGIGLRTVLLLLLSLYTQRRNQLKAPRVSRLSLSKRASKAFQHIRNLTNLVWGEAIHVNSFSRIVSFRKVPMTLEWFLLCTNIIQQKTSLDPLMEALVYWCPVLTSNVLFWVVDLLGMFPSFFSGTLA